VKRRKSAQNTNILKHASYLQKGTKVKLQKCGKDMNFMSCWWWLHHVMAMHVIDKEFCKEEINRIELSTCKMLEENLVHSAFQQTFGDKFTFKQDNNLNHKVKDTPELLTKMTLNVPEWPSSSFDLNWLERA
jgi:hypothetical protein